MEYETLVFVVLFIASRDNRVLLEPTGSGKTVLAIASMAP
jgi:DNA replication protein DnaC